MQQVLIGQGSRRGGGGLFFWAMNTNLGEGFLKVTHSDGESKGLKI